MRDNGRTEPEPNDQLVTQEHGGKLRRGGKRGNMGGQPEWFRAKLRSMGSHPRTLGYITQCLEGEHGAQAALAAWGHCLRYGLGDQSQVSVSGALKHVDMGAILARLPDDQVARVLGGEPIEVVLAELATKGAQQLLPAGRDVSEMSAMADKPADISSD